jgi:FixJ family two-component response regulator
MRGRRLRGQLVPGEASMIAQWISTLTPREAQTVRAVIDTGCNKGAARALGIAVKTVDFYLHQALRKSGLAFRVRMLIEYDRSTRSQQ